MTEETVEETTEVTAEEPANKLYRKTTLKELGNNYPIVPRDAEGKPVADRSFTFLDWDMEMEEHISGLREKVDNTGKFVNQMMCELLDTSCGEDFQAKKDGQKTLAITSMEFTNVMYAYIYLRVEELGEDLRMDLTCPQPRCKKAIQNFIADLNTLEVHVKDAEHERKGVYELRKPIALGEKIITKLTYDVSKWTCLENATVEVAENNGMMKRLMFESSITGAEDENGPVQHIDRKALISGLKKVDIEKAIRDVTENNAGPTLALAGECPHCKSEFFKELQWGYEYFFDSSSL